MANAVLNKILGVLGVGDEEEVVDEEMFDEGSYPYDIEEEEPVEEKRSFFGRKESKVTSISQQIKMKIAKPTSFEQAEDICILLREKNAIVINLEYVNKDVARRILDVISGAVKVLDGHFEKVSNSIFIVAPFNYDIVNDMTREEIKNKLSVSWLNK
jgi:cell division inhibitor SepF